MQKLSMACIAPSRLGPIRRICGTGGCDAAFLSISIRSSAAAATVAEICGAMAASVWNTFRIQLDDAGRLDGAHACGQRHAERHRNTRRRVPREAGSRSRFRPSLDDLRQLHLATDYGVQGPRPSFVVRVFAGEDAHVLDGACEVFELALPQCGEEWNLGQFIDRINAWAMIGARAALSMPASGPLLRADGRRRQSNPAVSYVPRCSYSAAAAITNDQASSLFARRRD